SSRVSWEGSRWTDTRASGAVGRCPRRPPPRGRCAAWLAESLYLSSTHSALEMTGRFREKQKHPQANQTRSTWTTRTVNAEGHGYEDHQGGSGSVLELQDQGPPQVRRRIRHQVGLRGDGLRDAAGIAGGRPDQTRRPLPGCL